MQGVLRIYGLVVFGQTNFFCCPDVWHKHAAQKETLHSFKMRMNHFILLLFTYYGFGDFFSVQFDIKFVTRVVPKLDELHYGSFKNMQFQKFHSVWLSWSMQRSFEYPTFLDPMCELVYCQIRPLLHIAGFYFAEYCKSSTFEITFFKQIIWHFLFLFCSVQFDVLFLFSFFQFFCLLFNFSDLYMYCKTAFPYQAMPPALISGIGVPCR